MTLTAGFLVNISFCVIKELDFFPIDLGAVFKKVSVDIFETMFCFCGKMVEVAFRWKMALNAMDNMACTVIIMSPQLPAGICHRMDMA
jgi:hypothetical protein